MTRRAVIYNKGSGSTSITPEAITEAFGDEGTSLIFLAISQGKAAILQTIRAESCEVLIAAGGDGTVNFVASLATELSVPMGILPVGTLNHFAKDLGLPIKLNEAAQIILTQQPSAVDYGTINDHVFVNNASIGVYPSTVQKREHLQPKLTKWPAAVAATLHALFRVSTTHIQVDMDKMSHTFKTPLVFVGNNSYQFEKVGFTNRDDLTKGELFLYVIRANRVTALLQLSILAFFGKRPRNKRDFLQLSQQPITLNSPKSQLDVAIDGEVVSLQPPLICVMHHKRLLIFR